MVETIMIEENNGHDSVWKIYNTRVRKQIDNYHTKDGHFWALVKDISLSLI